MFLKLAGRQVLVVGAGNVGEGKIAGILDTGARIRVVAREATEAVHDWARAGQIELELRSFSVQDLDGVFVAVVATASPVLNEFIYREAQLRGVLSNVVDVPELCDFFYPAVVRRGDLQIAISTFGQSPSLAQKLRQQLEQQLGQDTRIGSQNLARPEGGFKPAISLPSANVNCCIRWRAGKPWMRSWPKLQRWLQSKERAHEGESLSRRCRAGRS